MTPTELAAALRSPHPPHLLDVREAEENAFAALPGSKLIPLGEIFPRAGEIAAWKDEEIVVYCHHGMRSQMAIAQLRELGFARLHNLTGGIDRWSCEIDAGVRRY